MEEKLEQLKEAITRAAQDPKFVHHEWFVEYHLDIVECVSDELLKHYPEADRSIILALVWLHDYAKILDINREHDEAMFEKSRELLTQLTFPREFIDKTIQYLKIFESKMEEDLSTAPTEVQIVSSADAASHLIGPFFPLYWKENPDFTLPELTRSQRAKLEKDWNRKMVLPEVRELFRAHHNFFLDQVRPPADVVKEIFKKLKQ